MRDNSIDIFCDVVDNFGDAGVSFRLAKSLKNEDTGLEIRLFTNDLSAFSAIDNSVDPFLERQTVRKIELISYKVLDDKFIRFYEIPALVIEAFACHIPENYYNKALDSDCVIINLDHLSAEKWIEGVHLKESFTGKRAKKYFYMPGFTKNSGGIIRDRQLSEHEYVSKRKEFIGCFGFEDEGLLITVFTYEHDFTMFFSELKNSGMKANIVVFGEKSSNSIEPLMSMQDQNLKVVLSDFLDQDDYTDLLKVSDINFVRGEDSWARACLSGKPFIWHAYHQEDNYQLVKVKAFNRLLDDHFADKGLFDNYAEYLINFNGRSAGSKDTLNCFLFDNIKAVTESFSSFSECLFKNCNLTENLLKFLDKQKLTN